ncbi:MAG: ABC transporter ATP-binding protein [Hydrogenoanaerobacterium sp.]
MKTIVEMRNITKAFGQNVANDSVDFVCKAGEVLCLLGENGAGKTTLMNILYGLYKADSGEILFSGSPVKITGPRVAISMGIQMVHQHFMLIPTLSVADNVVLGRETCKNGFYDRKEAHNKVLALSEEYGLQVSPDKLVEELSVGEQQRVEIIKALYQGAKILILDEPTAVLTPQEVEDLFKVINHLRESGKTVIIITHKLKETMAISDRIYVLRQGRMIGERKTADTNIEELSELMVGQKITHLEKQIFESDKNIIELKHVNLKGTNGVQLLKDVSLTIREKEILGIAGVEGNGQMELLEVLSGLCSAWEGDIIYMGKTLRGRKTADLLSSGISCIHADRQSYSVVMNLDVPHNMLMGYQQTELYRKHKYFVDWKNIEKDSQALLEEYDVRPRDIQRRLMEFSGGNQQKFVVGREMKRAPKFLIAAHPTRGVDIMATAFIHDKLFEQKNSGGGVLLISSDLDELMEMSDRIAVIYDGQIVDCRPSGNYTNMELGRLMGGGRGDEQA